MGNPYGKWRVRERIYLTVKLVVFQMWLKWDAYAILMDWLCDHCNMLTDTGIRGIKTRNTRAGTFAGDI